MQASCVDLASPRTRFQYPEAFVRDKTDCLSITLCLPFERVPFSSNLSVFYKYTVLISQINNLQIYCNTFMSAKVRCQQADKIKNKSFRFSP